MPRGYLLRIRYALAFNPQEKSACRVPVKSECGGRAIHGQPTQYEIRVSVLQIQGGKIPPLLNFRPGGHPMPPFTV